MNPPLIQCNPLEIFSAFQFNSNKKRLCKLNIYRCLIYNSLHTCRLWNFNLRGFVPIVEEEYFINLLFHHCAFFHQIQYVSLFHAQFIFYQLIFIHMVYYRYCIILSYKGPSIVLEPKQTVENGCKTNCATFNCLRWQLRSISKHIIYIYTVGSLLSCH